MAESGSKRRALIVAIAAGGCVLLPALLIALVMVLHHPFETGESIASLEIEPGTAFELRYVSDGEPQRVWLDLECETCSLPVEGSLSVSAEGQVFEEVEVSAGEDDMGTRKTLDRQLIMSIDAKPAGTDVALRGTLTVFAQRGLFIKEPRTDVPPPAVQTLRVTIGP